MVYYFQWQKEQKLNAVLQQKKLLSLEKEMQLQKKVLKVKRNVRIYFSLNVIWQRMEHREVIESKSIPAMLVEEQIEKYELPTIEEGFDYLIKKV